MGWKPSKVRVRERRPTPRRCFGRGGCDAAGLFIGRVSKIFTESKGLTNHRHLRIAAQGGVAPRGGPTLTVVVSAGRLIRRQGHRRFVAFFFANQPVDDIGGIGRGRCLRADVSGTRREDVIACWCRRHQRGGKGRGVRRNRERLRHWRPIVVGRRNLRWFAVLGRRGLGRHCRCQRFRRLRRHGRRWRRWGLRPCGLRRSGLWKRVRCRIRFQRRCR